MNRLLTRVEVNDILIELADDERVQALVEERVRDLFPNADEDEVEQLTSGVLDTMMNGDH